MNLTRSINQIHKKTRAAQKIKTFSISVPSKNRSIKFAFFINENDDISRLNADLKGTACKNLWPFFCHSFPMLEPSMNTF